MRPAVFFRLRLRLRLQNTAELFAPILSLNLVQKLGGSQALAFLVGRGKILWDRLEFSAEYPMVTLI